jgi:hypothetical protein
MKKILFILSIVLGAFSAQAKINVVATLPDLGSLGAKLAVTTSALRFGRNQPKIRTLWMRVRASWLRFGARMS